jgi:probable F420-dependent oxidoreductase
MKTGALIPMMDGIESPADTVAFAREAEAMGFDYLVAYEHVIGGDPTGRPAPPRGRVTNKSFLHESLTLVAYLAAATDRIEFSTEVIVSTQRQTVLLAKQAAEVDYLSNGRLRLGIGAGWNALEFEALNEDFSTRGRRMDEQIDVMRALWTQDAVDYHGRWHRIDRAGITPRPVQQPIPIWIGGDSDAALRRVAIKADGWLPLSAPRSEQFEAQRAMISAYLEEAGRTFSSLGLEGQVYLGRGGEQDWRADIAAWRELGAGYLTVRTAGAGLKTLSQHLEALHSFRALLPD